MVNSVVLVGRLTRDPELRKTTSGMSVASFTLAVDDSRKGPNGEKVTIFMYWDGEKTPSVECPVGDFFASAYNSYAQLSSLAICVNPGSAFNCYWKMPFRKKARITMENIDTKNEMRLYYQINYTLTEVPTDEGYFHGDDCLVGKYGRVCSRNVRKDNFCTNQYTSSISFNCT